MFDVFYIGYPPKVFPHERQAVSLADARKKANTSYFWLISSQFDYTDFDFNWLPPPWENTHTHIFPSQWQRNSGTLFCPTNVDADINHYQDAMQVKSKPSLKYWVVPETIDLTKFDFSWHPDFEDEPYIYHFPSAWQNTSGLMYEMPRATGLKFASLQITPNKPAEIHFIDHYNKESADVFSLVSQHAETVKKARFVDNYFDTLARVVSSAESEYIWVVNSICDYTSFDFAWLPGVWQNSMMHVFPTGSQKFGDTFYIHVPSFIGQINSIKSLEHYQTIHFCQDQIVHRFNSMVDEIKYQCDTAVEAVKGHFFNTQYALFSPASHDTVPKFDVPLWRRNDRAIHVLTGSGSVIVAPREVASNLTHQLYEYPHIFRHSEHFLPEKDMDIVYISNGEPEATKWHSHLLKCAPNQKIHWVKDVPGRAAAYKEAARVSTTPWFLAVFAKLEVNPDFNWHWQPDYLQEPKHYIFQALNPVTGDTYGHQAMLAYNKKLVLETEQIENLDFTLSKAHCVSPEMSGIAHYDIDPWTTWRTAFRECVKLRRANDRDSKERLDRWLSVGNGPNGEWSIKGAKDGADYVDSVQADYEKLMSTFEWKWLRAYFEDKYGTL